MTAKRFTGEFDKQYSGVYDDGEQLTNFEVVDLLNELYEESKSSKEFIEQLQEELVLFKEAGANMGIDLNAQITALKQENEQLKHDLALYEENNTNEVLNQLRIELTSRLNDCIEEFKQ